MSIAVKVSTKSPSRRRKQLLYAFFALVVVAIGPYLVSRVRSPGRQIRLSTTATQSEVLAKTVSNIRVLSYNIAHGRGATDDNWEETAADKRKRIDQIAQLITTTDADVVVLNEVDFCSTWSGHQNQAEAIARATGYPYWVEQRNLDFRFIYGSWKFGNAVLASSQLSLPKNCRSQPFAIQSISWPEASKGPSVRFNFLSLSRLEF
jgi:hypothetical protein